jgi:hypothetical protein
MGASKAEPTPTRSVSGFPSQACATGRPMNARRNLRASAASLALASALAALLLVLAPAAQSAAAANPSLDVTYFSDGSISFTQSDGTPVGTASGAPTVIPAGYYTIVMTGPGGCFQVPYFNLQGPQVNITDNLDGDEVSTLSYNEQFLPNSTYTWSNNSAPGVVYTFTTSAQVVGAAPATAGASGIASDQHSTAPSVDLLGSQTSNATTVPFRGTVSGAVSAAGKLSLDFEGKSVSSLAAGRYTFTITDRSATNGFMLQESHHLAVTITGAGFLGKGSAAVDLSAGQWSFFTPRDAAKKTYFVVVN